jgi:hypothetical protein
MGHYSLRIHKAAGIAFLSICFFFLLTGSGGAIRWPFGAGNQSLPLGNNYGEYQYYGGSPYLHPGIDIMQYAGTPVYAVKAGIVKAVLTTSADLHWRVAIGDSVGSDWCDGWLYAHLDKYTIAVQEGDMVQVGDYLGDLVWWTVAGFHHLHFVKIRNHGLTWQPNWQFIANPLDELTPIDEPDFPVIENARVGAKFAFCENNTHTYFDPGAPLSGQVDIVSKIYDKTINTYWRMIPYRIEYAIFNDTFSWGPQLSFIFTDTLFWEQNVDVIYQDDATCNTRGDYDYRDFFFVVTNTDGDGEVEATDWSLGWNTEQFPNGTYWVKVTALDRYGNTTSDSMQVQVKNSFSIAGQVGLSDSPPDSSGSVVEILELAISDTTTKDGYYSFENIKEGYYSFRISHPGYITLDMMLQLMEDSTYNFNLQVGTYLSGDTNFDQQVNLGDAIYILNYLFKNGPIPVPFFSGDANCDDVVNMSDAIYLLNYLFRDGSPPC